jgi:hypothetical protein
MSFAKYHSWRFKTLGITHQRALLLVLDHCLPVLIFLPLFFFMRVVYIFEHIQVSGWPSKPLTRTLLATADYDQLRLATILILTVCNLRWQFLSKAILEAGRKEIERGKNYLATDSETNSSRPGQTRVTREAGTNSPATEPKAFDLKISLLSVSN